MQRRKEKCQNGQRLEWRSTPVHISNSTDPKALSIELCKRSLVDLACFSSNPPISLVNTATSHNDAFSSTTYEDLMSLCCDDLDHRLRSDDTTPSPGSTEPGIEDKDTSPDPSETKFVLKVPHMLVSFALDQNASFPNGEACRRWLSAFPGLAKHVKIEAVFDSYSSVLIMSIPVVIWNMLPDHPACQPISYVTSRNLMYDPQERRDVSFLETSLSRDIDTKEEHLARAASSSSVDNTSGIFSPTPLILELWHTLQRDNIGSQSGHEIQPPGSSLRTTNQSEMDTDPISFEQGHDDLGSPTPAQSYGAKNSQETSGTHFQETEVSMNPENSFISAGKANLSWIKDTGPSEDAFSTMGSEYSRSSRFTGSNPSAPSETLYMDVSERGNYLDESLITPVTFDSEVSFPSFTQKMFLW